MTQQSTTRRKALSVLAGIITLPTSLKAQSQPWTVAVAGATGRTGQRIATRAAAMGYRVRGLTRDAGRAAGSNPAVSEWISCDVRNPEDVALALDGVDAVICSIGYTQFAGPNGGQFVDYLGVRHLVDRAKENKLRHFTLISSGSAGPARDQTRNPLFGYVGFWKTKAENRLKESGLPFTVIGPAGLLDNPGGQWAIRAMTRPSYITLPMAQRRVDIGDVATVSVASLRDEVLNGKSFALLNDDGPPTYDWRQDIVTLEPEGPV